MDMKCLFYLLCCVGVAVANSNNSSSSSSGDETTTTETTTTTTTTTTESPTATTGPCILNEECSEDLLNILTATLQKFIEDFNSGNETGILEVLADGFEINECDEPVVECEEDLIEFFSVRKSSQFLATTFCLSISNEMALTDMLVLKGPSGVLLKLTILWKLEEDGKYKRFRGYAIPVV